MIMKSLLNAGFPVLGRSHQRRFLIAYLLLLAALVIIITATSIPALERRSSILAVGMGTGAALMLILCLIVRVFAKGR
jgi:hypothetical protein